MRNVIMWKKGEQSWTRWIKKRIKHNLNFLAIAEGPVGIGKSWAMISVAYDIDKEFEEKQIAFSFKRIMEILNSDWFNKKEWKIIVFDECQTDISNRQWQSLTNKLMNYLLSTFRHRNVILLFTSPYMDFIDNQSLKLMHCKFEIRGHNRKKKLTYIHPILLQWNSNMRKFYKHSLYAIRKGKYHKLTSWNVSKPPMHLIEPYEKSKIEFTDKLNKSIENELDKLEEKDEPRSILDVGTLIQRNTKRMFIKCKGNTKETAKRLGKGVRTVEESLGGREKMAELRDIYLNPLRNEGFRVKSPNFVSKPTKKGV